MLIKNRYPNTVNVLPVVSFAQTKEQLMSLRQLCFSQWRTKSLKCWETKRRGWKFANINNLNTTLLLSSQVWVAKEGVQSKLEELPIPFSDVRNIVEVIHLEDEWARSRCRAWVVLTSPKYLQADIICPGCIVDCRIMIRPLSSEFL